MWQVETNKEYSKIANRLFAINTVESLLHSVGWVVDRYDGGNPVYKVARLKIVS